MFKIAIVEDEEEQYLRLKSYIERYGKENGVAFNIEYFPNAVNFVSDYSYNYDLIFLDIMMPDINGMRAAEKIRAMDAEVAIIFVTNMEQYAIQGYNVSARYFIVKPIDYQDFANKLANTLTYVSKTAAKEYIMLQLPFDEVHKVVVDNIRYIEVFDHELVIHLYDEDIRMRGRISDFEKKLDPERFCRINSCYIVNLDCVQAVKDRSVNIGDAELSVSHARKKVLMKALANYVAMKE